MQEYTDIQSRLVTSVSLPSLSDIDIWEFIGDRGVYSESPSHMLACFDVFQHVKGKLYYRMKNVRPKSSEVINETGFSHPFFKGMAMCDPMGHFMVRDETHDKVATMCTHYIKDGILHEYEVLEN